MTYLNLCEHRGHDTYIDYYSYHIGCAYCLHVENWPTQWMTVNHQHLTYDNIHFLSAPDLRTRTNTTSTKAAERTAEFQVELDNSA